MQLKQQELSVPLRCEVAVVGGGPAGLMAAEVLSAAGVPVQVFDAMPTVGRKFLLAGIGGLNLTHAEPLPALVARYGAQQEVCARWLSVLSPQGVRDWAAGLGIDTFVGSSQRVFPTDMKAAPLLRAWLHRLRHPEAEGSAVTFHMRHRWRGPWVRKADGGVSLAFDTPQGQRLVEARAVVLALGGGSWARLGSDAAWVPWLQVRGVPLAPLQPANCGFDVAVAGRPGWSEWLRDKFAGTPLKGVVLSMTLPGGGRQERKGECVLTATGLEGSLVYAMAAVLREAVKVAGRAGGGFEVTLDLRPDVPQDRLERELQRPRQGRTLSQVLKRLGLAPVHVALLHEVLSKAQLADAVAVARAIKALPLMLTAPRPLDEAISTAGGVALEAMDEWLMLRDHPGVFCAGEMLDWEAPTGGYLLTACLASGRVAGQGARAWLGAGARQPRPT